MSTTTPTGSAAAAAQGRGLVAAGPGVLVRGTLRRLQQASLNTQPKADQAIELLGEVERGSSLQLRGVDHPRCLQELSQHSRVSSGIALAEHGVQLDDSLRDEESGL